MVVTFALNMAVASGLIVVRYFRMGEPEIDMNA